MTAPAIEVEGVSKRYRLGRGYGDQSQLSHRLDALIRAPFRRLGLAGSPVPEGNQEFWALRDVSLQVQPGEVFGLIGANGAGKSTLLKLLSRITLPTDGRITMRGAAGSLLEVGTGFHPELSGRENVMLNGAILGMRRKEILARYDEIVEFAGVEQFIETPVKRYSSGMLVRLGFAVAAHLNPEILIVDEVLAVGDAEFQRKCIGKMESAAGDGRTIVFVSHNMSSVRSLCDRVALIEKGRLTEQGRADQVIADYLDRVQPIQHGGISTIGPEAIRVGSGEAKVTRVSLLNDEGEPIEEVLFGQPFTVAIEFEVAKKLPSAVFTIGVSEPGGARILTANSTDRGGDVRQPGPGMLEVRARFEVTMLPGEFVVDVGVVTGTGQIIDSLERVISFTSRNLAPAGDDHYPWEPVVGTIRPDTDWEVREAASSSIRVSPA